MATVAADLQGRAGAVKHEGSIRIMKLAPDHRKIPWLLLALTALVFLLLGFGLARHLAGRPEAVVRAYHQWYHENGERTYNATYWLGRPAQKCPLDLWVMQEIIHETRPDVIIETGTYKGGSAYYFASIQNLMDHGRVITIDIEDFPGKVEHPRITYLRGSSVAGSIVEQVRSMIRTGERVMVLLDSDHSRDHVLQELRLYSPLVTPGCYLVVEDTHFNGHPILPKFGPGPMEALEEFLRDNADFEIDRDRQKFGMSFNPSGYLKRSR